MNTMNTLKSVALLAGALMFAACSNDDAAMTDVNHNLTISVSDSGFARESRTEDMGFATEFVAGDQIGVYAVEDGKLTLENACFTAAGEKGALSWTGAELLSDKATYYAYYPYSEQQTKVNPAALSSGDFFAEKISAWAPSLEQSTYEAYNSFDLMIAEGTVKDTTLSFRMAHKMAMMLVKFPATASAVEFEGMMPYSTAEGYRLVVRPSAKKQFKGNFLMGDEVKIFSFEGKAAGSGMYKTFNIE